MRAPRVQRGRLQRTSAKISDFKPPSLPLSGTRVCPNFQNHPLPGRPLPDFSIFTPYKYNLRIPLIKSIRQDGVLFTPGQLTPDN